MNFIFSSSNLEQQAISSFLYLISHDEWLPNHAEDMEDFIETYGIIENANYIFLIENWSDYVEKREGIYGPTNQTLLQFLDYILQTLYKPSQKISLDLFLTDKRHHIPINTTIGDFYLYHQENLFCLSSKSNQDFYNIWKENYIKLGGTRNHPMNILRFGWKFDFVNYLRPIQKNLYNLQF